MKRLFVVGVFMVCINPSDCLAQKSNGLYTLELDPNSAQSATAAIEGTYQFRSKKEGYQPLVSKDLLMEIEALRKENEAVVVSIDDFVELFIPSGTEIQSSNFSPLEKVIYISE